MLNLNTKSLADPAARGDIRYARLTAFFCPFFLIFSTSFFIVVSPEPVLSPYRDLPKMSGRLFLPPSPSPSTSILYPYSFLLDQSAIPTLDVLLRVPRGKASPSEVTLTSICTTAPSPYLDLDFDGIITIHHHHYSPTQCYELVRELDTQPLDRTRRPASSTTKNN